MRRRAAALAAILALGAACGDNIHPVAIDDYPAAVREALCRQLVRCGEVESIEDCLVINLGTVAFTASERAAIDSGAIIYDAIAARTCVDGIASQSCDRSSESSRRGPAACGAVAAGTGRAGDRCAFDLECRSRLCQVPRCDQACCAGACAGDEPPRPAPLAPPGAACTRLLGCAYGTLCIDLRCQAPPALGQPCTGPCRDAGTVCSHLTGTCVRGGLRGAACTIGLSECSPAYLCDRTGHCSAGIALGQPCGLGDRCAVVDAFCDVALGASEGQCALPRRDGAPCVRDAGCTSLYCDPFTLHCAPEPICL